VIFAENTKDVERILEDPYLKMNGIIFSKKTKKDGTLASKFLEGNEIEFLNCKLNFETGIIQSEKGIVHVDSEEREINKIL